MSAVVQPYLSFGISLSLFPLPFILYFTYSSTIVSSWLCFINISFSKLEVHSLPTWDYWGALSIYVFLHIIENFYLATTTFSVYPFLRTSTRLAIITKKIIKLGEHFWRIPSLVQNTFFYSSFETFTLFSSLFFQSFP